MSTPILEVRDLSVSYGQISATQNISFSVPEGKIVTIIGPNGAGKTTTLNAIAGLLPYGGTVMLNGRNIDKLSVEDRVYQAMHLAMHLVPETRELFVSMTVADNLRLGAYRLKEGREAVRARMEDVYKLFPRLKERAGQSAGTLSGGERQMLALGRALMCRPKLLMLDEPSLGLAPRIVQDIFKIIARLRDDGVSILLVEQNARAALRIADYGYVLETGTIAFGGPADVLAMDEKVIESYLGLARA
jgi:branched-chain amino acid transport system ATP-binding protein